MNSNFQETCIIINTFVFFFQLNKSILSRIKIFTRGKSSVSIPIPIPSGYPKEPKFYNTNKFEGSRQVWKTSIIGGDSSTVTRHKFELAQEYQSKGVPATADILNKLCDTHITDKDIESLLLSPRIIFTQVPEKKTLIRTIRKRGVNAPIPGIYIWTHKPSGSKYVGSAYNMPVRLRSYFSEEQKEIGKFIPLFYRQGMDIFTLEVVLTPFNPDIRLELLLEQYYLLDSAFDLNTIRVAGNGNPSGSNSKTLYIYNRDITILYYSSNKQSEFINKFKINYHTFTKHLIKGTYYLGKYVFTRERVEEAVLASLARGDIELREMLTIDRVKFNLAKPVNSLSRPVNIFQESTRSTPNLGILWA